MGCYSGPNIIEDGLVLALDAGSTKLKRGSYYYKWFITAGGNPTTKSTFDAFFAVSPQGQGVEENNAIDWLSLALRPSYITTEISFAWEVSGYLIIDEPGTYIFNTRSDDGNELVINGQLLTSFYGGRGVPNPGDLSSPIFLNSGVYPFLYRMQQGSGGAGAQVRWQKPGSSTYEVIPLNNFAVPLTNGTTWFDLSGRGNNGTLVNGVGYDSNNGGSLVFDGIGTVDGVTSGSNIDVPESITSTNNYLNGCTYNIWLKVDTDAVDRMSLFYGSSTIRHIELYSSSRYFRTEAARQNGYSFGSSVFPDNIRGEWGNFTIVFANSESGRPVRWFQNGKLFSTNSMDGGSFPGIEYFSFNKIGRSTGTTQYLYAKSFDGAISVVQIYNRALTASEIQQNFNATRSRFGV
jgi:hypothetical protein